VWLIFHTCCVPEPLFPERSTDCTILASFHFYTKYWQRENQTPDFCNQYLTDNKQWQLEWSNIQVYSFFKLLAQRPIVIHCIYRQNLSCLRHFDQLFWLPFLKFNALSMLSVLTSARSACAEQSDILSTYSFCHIIICKMCMCTELYFTEKKWFFIYGVCVHFEDYNTHTHIHAISNQTCISNNLLGNYFLFQWVWYKDHT